MSNSDNMSRKIGMSERDMLQHIMEELRQIRGRLDAHIDAQNDHFRGVQKDQSKMREELATHKVKIGTWTAFIAIAVTGVVNWIIGRVS